MTVVVDSDHDQVGGGYIDRWYAAVPPVGGDLYVTSMELPSAPGDAGVGVHDVADADRAKNGGFLDDGRCDPVVVSGQWPQDPDERVELESRWHPVFGDRQQELVLIGVGLDGDGLRKALVGCLLTDTEVAAGEDAWRLLPDPFPGWTSVICTTTSRPTRCPHRSAWWGPRSVTQDVRPRDA
ncbi:cobalamin synthesis protein P47K [Micromonospora maris AB-18-032]|uniref:CobW C-terminal domain-containing protein n=1 Tax=Micromonospora maris TaxID=1003110 RepID=A0A9X0HZE1_9ACTN|nr:cobalamin synthesis protein P47K [Micromonospora maris AB-18-032]KUJ43952.1 hypothetical protein ADL17_11915 [Micromonospora maris]